MSDTVPQATTLKKVRAGKARDVDVAATSTGDATGNNADKEAADRRAANNLMRFLQPEGAEAEPTSPKQQNHSMAHSPIVDRTVHITNGNADTSQSTEDVEMAG